MSWDQKTLKLNPKRKEAKALVIRERTESKNKNQGKQNKYRSKSWGKDKKCYYCPKEGHFIKNCYQLKNKNKNQEKNEEQNAANVHEGYDLAEVLTVSENSMNDE